MLMRFPKPSVQTAQPLFTPVRLGSFAFPFAFWPFGFPFSFAFKLKAEPGCLPMERQQADQIGKNHQPVHDVGNAPYRL